VSDVLVSQSVKSRIDVDKEKEEKFAASMVTDLCHERKGREGMEKEKKGGGGTEEEEIDISSEGRGGRRTVRVWKGDSRATSSASSSAAPGEEGGGITRAWTHKASGSGAVRSLLRKGSRQVFRLVAKKRKPVDSASTRVRKKKDGVQQTPKKGNLPSSTSGRVRLGVKRGGTRVDRDHCVKEKKKGSVRKRGHPFFVSYRLSPSRPSDKKREGERGAAQMPPPRRSRLKIVTISLLELPVKGSKLPFFPGIGRVVLNLFYELKRYPKLSHSYHRVDIGWGESKAAHPFSPDSGGVRKNILSSGIF